MKIGDGVTPWSDLEWFGGDGAVSDGVTQEQLEEVIAQITALDEKIGEPAADGTDATGFYGEIAALIANMESKMDEKIAAFANLTTDDGKINTLIEAAEYIEAHKEETEELRTAIDTLDAATIKEIAVNGVLCDVVDGRVDLNISTTGTGIVSGDEVAVNEDGTLSIVSIDASKLVTSEETSIVLNGGSASV